VSHNNKVILLKSDELPVSKLKASAREVVINICDQVARLFIYFSYYSIKVLRHYLVWLGPRTAGQVGDCSFSTPRYQVGHADRISQRSTAHTETLKGSPILLVNLHSYN
jgi:hypothetical protein